MASAFVAAMPQIKQIIIRKKPPCVCTVSKSGNVSLFLTHDQLLEKIGKNTAGEQRLHEFDAKMKEKQNGQ